MRIVILLLLSILVYSQVVTSVTCKKEFEFQLDTSSVVTISFSFSALAPLGMGGQTVVFTEGQQWVEVWGERFLNLSKLLVASTATSGLWDRDLTYSLTLEYFKPGDSWVIGEYFCKARYDNGLEVIQIYYKVEKEPAREVRQISFVVLQTQVLYRTEERIYVSLRPDVYYSWLTSLCKELPDSLTWPRCTPYTRDNYVVSASSPRVWKALEINSKKPGEIVVLRNVYAVVPNPWLYGECYLGRCSASISTDRGIVVYIGDVYNIPFSKRVDISIIAAPIGWGEIEVRPPRQIPLYVSRVVQMGGFSCRPPDCFVVDEVGNATWIGKNWVWNWTLASIAVKTPHILVPYVAVGLVQDGQYSAIGRGVSVYMPLGSVAVLKTTVLWRLEMGNKSVWIGSTPGTYLRVVDDRGNIVDYEEAASRGKLEYRVTNMPLSNTKWAVFETAVDETFRKVYTAWYSPPNPCSQWPRQLLNCVHLQHVYTKVNGTFLSYTRVGTTNKWPVTHLALIDWLIPKIPRICGRDRFSDFMSLVVGDPALYFWHTYRLRTYEFNPSTGDWDIPRECEYPPPHQVSMLSSVYNTASYRNTTRGFEKLYFETAEGNGTFYNYVFEGVNGYEYPAGWTDVLPLGIPSMTTNTTSPWLVFLVPTTACRSIICTSLDVTLWGPTPGPTPDLALPGAGYSFLIIYTGTIKNITIRIFIEKGFVAYIQKGVIYKPVENYMLTEVKKLWKPLDGVYVGPGWWTEYKPLVSCQYLSLGEKSIYVTPTDWAGPLILTIEEFSEGASKRYSYVFFISNNVSYRIDVTSTTPQNFTTLYLNVSLSLYVNRIPYFHGYVVIGEGGRVRPYICKTVDILSHSFFGGVGQTSQLTTNGEFWGEVDIVDRIRLVDKFVIPSFEIVYFSRGVVKINAEGPVIGFAFYLMRNGIWTKVGEALGSCVLINATLIYPWDPLLVLPIVKYHIEARAGDVVVLWRPKPSLFFKTWADSMGYSIGVSSTLEVLGKC
ncbi:conserved hypothetical protein [Pyrobaculum islandicum DSM 4184]|uniref:Uncharacterized protein n=1 Tax=Pyrobaculum islandicum (strain DSM 4184 / JCM 9189 / GEO3) TaxID=384616 RepID=A1RSX1_PYRIL|nr:hypothetical protein [Pyrobaculum islandicum]ABL88053.1 conserved hypothetical protein [Pyrobaculum islandicum DSM 4184]